MATVVAGAGVAGLFTAWYLCEAGEEVTVIDGLGPAQGCTRAAAGMLAPVQEIEFQEPEILAAGLEGLRLYEALEDEWGSMGLDRSGTLEVALDADDAGYLKRLYEFQREKGMKVEWLQGRQVLEAEPFLSVKIPAAIFASGDIQIDHLFMAEKLCGLLKGRGVKFIYPEMVTSCSQTGESVFIVTNKSNYKADRLVLATGMGLPGGMEAPVQVYPVRGEMLSLEPPPHDFLRCNVRIRSKTLGYGYVVPKPGRVLAGSTMEEKGMDASNTAGGLLDILRRAYAAVPGIFELRVKEMWAGLRPATLSRLPVIDKVADQNLYCVNGFYRHGIMMGPALGRAAAEFILSGRRDTLISKFTMPHLNKP